MKRGLLRFLLPLIAVCLLLTSCDLPALPSNGGNVALAGAGEFSLDDVPAYDKEPFVAVNDNQPWFSEKDLTTKAYETYGALDEKGRCTVCVACIGRELMPTEKRESISKVRPSGWKQAMYDFVDGNALYNRCHLIGFQLTGENANERNLITGTRYMNTEGMLPFENMVTDYVKETDNHVLYRVTPIFRGNNLVADGVLMESYSVEDKGDGICYAVYCYNVQPGVEIDYSDGTSRLQGNNATGKTSGKKKYVVNKNTGKFHLPDCPSATEMQPGNRLEIKGTREELIEKGYRPCGTCHP